MASADREAHIISRRWVFQIPMRIPGDGEFSTTRKQNNDQEFHFSRIDSDADDDLRTGARGNDRAERVV
jgi:hypothetical protein